jgi:hypothetical protein
MISIVEIITRLFFIPLRRISQSNFLRERIVAAAHMHSFGSDPYNPAYYLPSEYPQPACGEGRRREASLKRG